jgi:presenilin-like A22 family membrane protease
MKHKPLITIILLSMFLITQVIGLFVVYTYTPVTEIKFNPATGEKEEIRLDPGLPFGLETPENDPSSSFISIVFAFVLAFALIFLLMKYKWAIIIRLWFFFVVTLALGISINAFFSYTNLANISIISLAIALPLSTFKIFRPNFVIHNATELLIYPGIAAVFVPILTPLSSIALLVLISIYDMWAVWKVGLMQKMARYQMEEIKVFGGFLLPSLPSKVKKQIQLIRQKYKGKKIPEKLSKKKFKVNLAILGGGDVIFPIIVAGVFMRAFGIVPALFVTFGSLAGLIFLMLITQKGKAYPAMPYISSGAFLGMLIAKLFLTF